MAKVNIAQAKAKLSELIDAALRGEEVIIARRNKPVVKLEVVQDTRPGSLLGMFKGEIWMSPDFDDPLPEFADYMISADRLEPKLRKRKQR